jgi:serine/threonine protein kinase
MAPEIYLMEKYNFPIDVWSIGCLLYELMTNEIPFPAKNIQEITYKITRQPPQNYPRDRNL